MHSFDFLEARGKYGPGHPVSALLNECITGGGSSVTGGGVKVKHWTTYDTWEALYANDQASSAYLAELDNIVDGLDVDWSGVRSELKDKLYDNREWAGRINIVNGVAKIVELVPSPYLVGEGPLDRQAAAMIPADVIAAIEAKPAYFTFHTHPGKSAGSALPSPIDFVGAIWNAYTGRFMGDLVVSPYGIFMYGPSKEMRDAIWRNGNNAAQALLIVYRYIADLLGVLNGSRSWSAPWTIEAYTRILAQYNVDYVVFPTDMYAQLLYRSSFISPPAVDQDTIHTYHKLIQKSEAELQD